MKRVLGCLSMVLLATLLAPNVEARAAGTWVVDIDELVAAVAGRWAVTAPLQPAVPVAGPEATVTTVHWRFRLLNGEGSRAELCQQQRCIAVRAQGRSTAFAGMPAEAPFRFRLKRDTRVMDATRLQHGQLIVNFR